MSLEIFAVVVVAAAATAFAIVVITAALKYIQILLKCDSENAVVHCILACLVQFFVFYWRGKCCTQELHQAEPRAVSIER